jgi:hypothetical protein
MSKHHHMHTTLDYCGQLMVQKTYVLTLLRLFLLDVHLNSWVGLLTVRAVDPGLRTPVPLAYAYKMMLFFIPASGGKNAIVVGKHCDAHIYISLLLYKMLLLLVGSDVCLHELVYTYRQRIGMLLFLAFHGVAVQSGMHCA